MSKQQTPSSETSSPDGVDRHWTHGLYARSALWHDDLNRRFTQRALDMPEDDMQNVGNRHGMTWRELAVVAAMVLGAGGLGAWAFSSSSSEPQQQQQPATMSPVDAEYEVRFFDADGNPIRVPHISEREQ